MSVPMMEITLVKAAWPGDRDRACLTAGDVAWRGPITSSMTFRTWSSSPCSASPTGRGAELAAGSHAAADRLWGSSRPANRICGLPRASPSEDDH
jgi:hypothetical protein